MGGNDRSQFFNDLRMFARDIPLFARIEFKVVQQRRVVRDGSPGAWSIPGLGEEMHLPCSVTYGH